jgi:hypothetical protein
MLRIAALGEQEATSSNAKVSNEQATQELKYALAVDQGGLQDEDSTHERLPARINRRRNHKQDQLNVLTRWFNAHADDPYPSPEEKYELARKCNMEVRQIEHWFTNRRKRHWSKPSGIASPDDGMTD